MNWFTKDYVKNQTTAQKQKLVEMDGGCEHAEADASTVAYVRCEKDSFGIVGSYACCEECDKKADEEEDNEEHVCADCKETKPLKDGFMWKWYDFYEAQGDEALFVCNCCRPKETHRQRVARDRAAHEEEFGIDDHDDDGDQDHEELGDHDPAEDYLDCGHRYDLCDCKQEVEQKALATASEEKPKLVTGVAAWPFPTPRK